MHNPEDRRTITAAFAGERDADYALSLIATSGDITVAYTREVSYDDRGDVAIVVVAATVACEVQASRAETLIAGAHGVRIPSGATPP